MNPTVINMTIGILAGLVTIITGMFTLKKAWQEGRSPKSPKESKHKALVPPPQKPRLLSQPPIGSIPGVHEFSQDEAGYQEWVLNHPQGFVINTFQPDKDQSKYMVLHKATCGSISNFGNRKPGAFTTREFMKVCAMDIESLKRWARLHGRPDGSFTNEDSCSVAGRSR